MLVSNFSHTPGVHCGSTALRDALSYIGLHYSEPMCFGLGSGLGLFYYRTLTGSSPSHNIYGRTITLERDLCRHLALEWKEGTEDDPARAWEQAKAWLDRGVPLLLYVELSQLPYYHTRTPFPGHRVILAGYDDDRQVALLADTHFPDLQPISYAALAAARSVRIPPIPLHNEWLAIQPTPSPRPLREAIRLALRDNALGMNLDRSPHQGIMGMEMLAEDLSRWSDFPDWEFCVRLSYQNIEVRGTGGGMFRRMYAQFLREAEALDPDLAQAWPAGPGHHPPRILSGAQAESKDQRGERRPHPERSAAQSKERPQSKGLAADMESLADEWTALAGLLQRISTEQDPQPLADAGRRVRRLALREENFWGRVLDLVG